MNTTLGGSKNSQSPPQSPPIPYTDGVQYQERLILQEDFAVNGITLDLPVTCDELVNKLKHSRRPYDELTLRSQFTIAAASDRDDRTEQGEARGTVTGKKLIDQYVKRKREVEYLNIASLTEVERLEKLIRQSERALRAVTASEEKNMIYKIKHNIAEESKLTVQLISLRNLPDGEQGMGLKLHLDCQHQEIESSVRAYRGKECLWNELVSFQIGSPEGDLKIVVFKVDHYNGLSESLGQFSVLLDDLSDQKKHEIAKEVAGGEVLLSCQWIFSKQDLYLNYLREFTSKRDTQLNEIDEYQSELTALRMPFTVSSEDQGVSALASEGNELLVGAIDSVLVAMKLTNYQVAMQVVIAVYMLLSCIASCTRPLFLDLIIALFAFWCNLDPRRWKIEYYSSLILATIVSLALDVAWIHVYFRAWSGDSVEIDMQTVSKAFTLFNFLWKIPVLCFFWKSRHHLKRRIEYQDAMFHRLRHPTPSVPLDSRSPHVPLPPPFVVADAHQIGLPPYHYGSYKPSYSHTGMITPMTAPDGCFGPQPSSSSYHTIPYPKLYHYGYPASPDPTQLNQQQIPQPQYTPSGHQVPHIPVHVSTQLYKASGQPIDASGQTSVGPDSTLMRSDTHPMYRYE